MRRPFKIIVKNVLGAMLYWSGFVFLYRIIKKNQKPNCRILCYHSINTLPTDFFTMADRLTVLPKMFRKQLQYLKKHFAIFSETELIGFLNSSNEIKKNAVLITLDDGYQDNFEKAMPLLKKFRAPAIVYLSGREDNLSDFSWWHDLALVVDKEVQTNHSDQKINPQNEYWNHHQSLEAISSEDRVRKLDEKIKEFNKSELDKRLHFLTTENIQRMMEQDIAFGGHTVNHVDLGQVDSATARTEIVESLKLVADQTDRNVVGFAYPFGKKENYTDDVIDILRESKLKYAVTTDWGFNDQNSDPFRLKRIVIDGTDSIWTFICKVEGIIKT